MVELTLKSLERGVSIDARRHSTHLLLNIYCMRGRDEQDVVGFGFYDFQKCGESTAIISMACEQSL